MNRILYDKGPLTLLRWLLQRAFKFEPPFGPGSELKKFVGMLPIIPQYWIKTTLSIKSKIFIANFFM